MRRRGRSRRRHPVPPPLSSPPLQVFNGASLDSLDGSESDAFYRDAGFALAAWASFAERARARPDAAALWRTLRATAPDLMEFDAMPEFEAGIETVAAMVASARGGYTDLPPPGVSSLPPAARTLGWDLYAAAGAAARDPRTRARVKAALRASGGGPAPGDGGALGARAPSAAGGRALLVLDGLGALESVPTGVRDDAIVTLLLRKLGGLGGGGGGGGGSGA
jgi:hypothetical protein